MKRHPVIRSSLVGAIALGLALAGCAAGEDHAPTASSSTPTTSAAASTTPADVASSTSAPPVETTMASESVAQWASRIAEYRAEMPDDVDGFEGCTPWAICSIQALTLSYEASTIDLILQNGTPPAELTDVVADTRAAAQQYTKAYEEFTTAGCAVKDPDHDTCDVLLIALQVWANGMSSSFYSWDPWL